MGRELRMVPPNWQHPKSKSGPRAERDAYQPLLNQSFTDAFAEWLDDFDRIRRGEFGKYETSYQEDAHPLAAWLADYSPPKPEDYRPYTDAEATWFQIYETVSEGTPVTPPFATKAELVDHLVKHGDDWQQKRWKEGNRFMQPEKPGYSREAAEAFVESGWAPSMMITTKPDGSRAMATGINVPLAMKDGR